MWVPAAVSLFPNGYTLFNYLLIYFSTVSNDLAFLCQYVCATHCIFHSQISQKNRHTSLKFTTHLSDYYCRISRYPVEQYTWIPFPTSRMWKACHLDTQGRLLLDYSSLWRSGFRSRWPNSLEQSPGFHQGPVNQHWLFQTFTEDVSVCAILVHAAH